MLDPQTLPLLQTSKNLLAFSAGVDSTALFHLLLHHNIPFDMAIVNYHTRKQSDLEVNHAKQLAQTYSKKLYIKESSLNATRYEQDARTIRYSFFETVIENHAYTTLLTAHQLNDQLEWFLMQLGKGAGSLELLGMQALTQKKGYTLVRPLLQETKQSLQNYLDQHSFTYFIDESNQDTNLKRNAIRHTFSDPFLQHFEKGVKQSFAFLQEDNTHVLKGSSSSLIHGIHTIKALNERARLYHIDKVLKKNGILISTKQRQELTHTNSLVVAHRLIIERYCDVTFIVPLCDYTMTKNEKEHFRVAKVPVKMRPYLAKHKIAFLDLL